MAAALAYYTAFAIAPIPKAKDELPTLAVFYRRATAFARSQIEIEFLVGEGRRFSSKAHNDRLTPGL